MKTALTIAGSDSSGGAGIQADIKTMMANGVYAMSAITALTAQNTTGVAAIQNATPEFLAQEIDCIFTDIEPDAVKVGMVSEKELIKVISDKLKQYKAKNIVIDPVMVATSGARLINEDAVDTLKKELFHLATILTPNIPEAEELAQIKINNSKDMIKAAEKIAKTYNCAVLCKGGHNQNDASDLLYKDNEYFNDKEKVILGYDTSIELNINKKIEIIKKINNIKNLTISYKLFDNSGNYTRCDLINDINIIDNYKTK